MNRITELQSIFDSIHNVNSSATMPADFEFPNKLFAKKFNQKCSKLFIPFLMKLFGKKFPEVVLNVQRTNQK